MEEPNTTKPGRIRLKNTHTHTHTPDGRRLAVPSLLHLIPYGASGGLPSCFVVVLRHSFRGPCTIYRFVLIRNYDPIGVLISMTVEFF